MKKELYRKDLEKIQDMAGKIRTINEGIRFNEEFGDEDSMQYDMPQDDAPVEPDEIASGEGNLANMKAEEPTEEDGLRELGEVDQIREIALRGMIKLCKTPEDERYQALKKIFQFCDKAAETKDKEDVR